MPQFVFLFGSSETRSSFFHNECGDAIFRIASIGDRHHDRYVTYRSMSDEIFCAVQDPCTVAFLRDGLETFRIAAGIWFGQRPCSDFLTRGKRSQKFLFLFFVGKEKNVIGTESIVSGHTEPYGGVNTAKFFDDARII